MSSSSRLCLCGLFAAVLAVGLGCHQLDYSSRYGAGEIAIYDDLFSVSVVDENHVVAVGYQGAAYWTDDGGDAWHKGKVPTNKLLYSVSMANAQVGWAVGQLGTILRTEDGGRTWTLQPNLKADESTHLFGVAAIDPQRAIAVGEWGSRIYTNDGGRTWVDDSLTVGIDHPQFVWLSLEDQDKVRNGGKVYEDVTLQDVSCLRGTTDCWIIGEFGYIFRSEDDGQTWTRGEIEGDVRMEPIVLQYDQLSLDDAQKAKLAAFAKRIEDETHLNVLIDVFVSKREIKTYYKNGNPEDLFDVIAARLDETKGVLEEAGLMTDRLRMYNKPPWDYEDFLEHDPTFLKRYIEGRTSEIEQPQIKVSVIQNPFLFTVRFKDAQHGLIAGLGGVVLRSDDGGRTWNYVMTERKQALFAVASTDGRAIAVGEKGLVEYSKDGGRSWHPPSESQFPSVFTYMRDLNFAPTDVKTGFIVGQEGMVLRTRDGGNSWQQILPPPDRRGVGSIEG
jgi:photosystem II stability/assembly factor-like uncharacterized protein